MSEERFSKLKYDVTKNVYITDEYPDLKKFKELTSLPKTFSNKILKYLFLMYDPGSDLIFEFKDLDERKNEAAILAGFEKEGRKWGEKYREVMALTNPKVLKAVHAIVTKIFFDREYREWQILNHELDEATKRRLTPVVDQGSKGLSDLEKKTKLREECRKMMDKIDILEGQIFGENDDLKEIAIKGRFYSPDTFAPLIVE